MLVHAERLGVEDVVALEERAVRLDALRAKLAELRAVADEAAGRVQVEHPHGLVAHVSEPVDDVRRGEDVRARVAWTTSSPTWNSTSPSRTKNESLCALWK